MILPDHELIQWASDGGIHPFNSECINPASIDLRISTNYVIGLKGWEHKGSTALHLVVSDPVLVSTIEYIKMPHDHAGVVYLKSSLARQGLDHALAGFIDPGFEGTLTLELHTHYPITLTHMQRVIQLVLYRLVSTPMNTYHGKYMYQEGPTRAYKEI